MKAALLTSAGTALPTAFATANTAPQPGERPRQDKNSRI